VTDHEAALVAFHEVMQEEIPGIIASIVRATDAVAYPVPPTTMPPTTVVQTTAPVAT
jgi:hypothetical protein